MKKVSKSILTILTAASVILPSSVFAEPAESEANLNLSAEQQQQYNIEKQYLNDVVHTINTTIGSTEALDEYGELYIDTQTGYKFVLALASTDEKTNQLGEKLKSIVPSEFLEFKSVKYSKSQLDKMRDEIAQDLEGSGVTNYEINTSVKDQKSRSES
ncbi:hypothetical protein OMP38_16205 [Cohnella ginsengisoli]|uniref:Inhibitor I9 domain-containing protein n=1 Tax=Cohnella ginsengisoli TaxID=425004 RepID=A0A9X4KHT3_9BACL|nr:hypothetical protein [Cohnella ginsengisoli]MDG0792236.1 hypothetical protein [Cohnella ginsengisoli]